MPLLLLSAAVRAALGALLPSGGQLTARRNAWAGMSSCSARARQQREADAALAGLQVRSRAVR